MAETLTTGIQAIGDLRLQSGEILPDARIAYATAGTLSAAKDNVVLVTHGFTSSHMFIGGSSDAASEGSWANMVGPGRAIDTDRFFVVSSNMLGSAYGSTAPRSTDPRTGRPYGLYFPFYTLTDMVEAQRLMLAAMGIERLVAVVGPSYGGFQALTWAIDHPERMRGISMSVSGLKPPGGVTPDGIVARLATDPNWHGGQYYDQGGIEATMTAIREKTLRDYGLDDQLKETMADPAARDAEITRQARGWALGFDGNSMVVLARAMEKFDASDRLDRIRARVQYVICRTDKLFPPEGVPATMRAFEAAGVRAEHVPLDSDFGHQASGSDWSKWDGALKRFLESL